MTRYTYTFAGTDGRNYVYEGGYLIEPGAYLDCMATIKYVRRYGREIWFSRPKRLARKVDEPAFI